MATSRTHSDPKVQAAGRVARGRRNEKIAESVARQILRDIQLQGLAPGSMLPPESAMLERFDIGRGSLREALRILEVNGLITIKTGPGGGRTMQYIRRNPRPKTAEHWTLAIDMNS